LGGNPWFRWFGAFIWWIRGGRCVVLACGLVTSSCILRWKLNLHQNNSLSIILSARYLSLFSVTF
jgi:hypothetical protein